MEALSGLVDVHFTLITRIPEWFFRNSIPGSFTVHPVQVDVGLVQRSALEIDLPATVNRLGSFYPLHKKILQNCSSALSGCHLVVSDIAPLGIAAAREANIPSVLLENFTWDWIYEAYLAAWPQLNQFITHIKELYSMADWRIQAEPVCTKCRCDLLAAPIARKIRNNRDAIRSKLNVQHDKHLVLLSMGGEGIQRLPLDVLEKCPDTVFLVSGLKDSVQDLGNLRILREDSGFFHPDLVAASDAVVGKVGYSTLAEVYHAGVPFGYIQRPDFRESEPLSQFVKRNMGGISISVEEFVSGGWVEVLPRLFALGGDKKALVNGADQCAEFIASLLPSHSKTP